MQIHQALGDPFASKSMPMLEYVLAGIKRTQAKSSLPPASSRLPITPDLLACLQSSWLRRHLPPDHDSIMLWAAACTGFFGFLRAGEFTVPSAKEYDPAVHLNLADVAIDSHTAPSVIRLRIKQSKTDPFRQGVDVFLGASNSPICPVQAMIQFIAVRDAAPGPLFKFEGGSPLTRSSLISHTQSALSQAGIPPGQFTGHSYRIGAATTAAKAGIEDSLIQILGRWKSAAYLAYIRIPKDQLAAVAASLVRPRGPCPANPH